MKIAVIGSGISGLVAAWALKDTADVTVFEKRDRIGGHSCTMDIDYDGAPLSVDIGFIVYNAGNYPNLIALFEHLDVKTQASDMSFAVSNPDGFEWSSNAKGLFAWKRNLLRPKFHRFWRAILAFNTIARQELEAGTLDDVSLGAWLDRHGFDDTVRENYILPMGAAIWSTPEQNILDYPALSFFNFFNNHRLMHRERPKWRTVSGGSRHYVDRFKDALGDRLKPNCAISQITKSGAQVVLHKLDGSTEIFDQVILACHSDQSALLLEQSFPERSTQLSSIRYRPNRIYLHRDEALMPKRRNAWAAWNVLRQGREDICLTYWMNILQGLPMDRPVFVTLNPDKPPREETIFSSTVFAHPQFDQAAQTSVDRLKAKNGENGVWLAGAWMGSGFHEDGLKSGLEAALSLGGKVPWEPQNLTSFKSPVYA